MARFPSVEELADQVGTFALQIEPAKERWLYCLSRVKSRDQYRDQVYTNYAERTIKVCERILGRKAYCSRSKFKRLDELGYEGAKASSRVILSNEPYCVGPLERWHLGHVYFVRVVSHPHVVKIGFSRRVRDRLDDIESKCKTPLTIGPSNVKVGTLADEHWWHHNWRNFRIEGEWFFDPFVADRSLPEFLQTSAKAAA